jgi:putative intracellular protease/amidase
MKSLKSLLITTSNNRLDDSPNKTGVWMEDLAAPYFILRDSGEFITIASPLGGQIPLDLNSQSADFETENTKRFNKDIWAMYHFSHSLPLNEIKAEEFDLVFLVGGYGAILDFQNNRLLNNLLISFNVQHKPIGLVGHAAVALLSLSNTNNEAFVKGKKLTAFSNHEAASIRLQEQPLFSLESKLVSLGALYSSGPDFKSYVVADDNIITGQNPASSSETANQIISFAKAMPKEKMLQILE